MRLFVAALSGSLTGSNRNNKVCVCVKEFASFALSSSLCLASLLQIKPMQVTRASNMATFYINRLARARSSSLLPESCLSEESMHLAPNSNHSTKTAGITETLAPHLKRQYLFSLFRTINSQ